MSDIYSDSYRRIRFDIFFWGGGGGGGGGEFSFLLACVALLRGFVVALF